MKIIRRKTKIIKIGKARIGGNNPIAIQSMAKCKTAEIEKTVKQIKDLEQAGCEIVRVAVRDHADAAAIKKIRPAIRIPLVADIHFNWRLATEAIDNGADKIRLNPGNIYRKEQIREVAASARAARIPIRVGVNSGSVEKHSLSPGAGKAQVGLPAGQAGLLVKSALDYIKILEGFKFRDIVVSLKASNVLDTVEAYRLISAACEYPLHLGVTATGLPYAGAIKSSMALGILLSEGIGDTIRVSLTDSPGQEVKAARIILGSLGLRQFGPEIISCPTCGRCEVDLVSIVKQLEKRISTTLRQAQGTSSKGTERSRSVDYRLWTRPLKVAVMGCEVNGPGEARQADIGIAFGKKEGLLFKKGRPIKKIPVARCIEVLLKEL